MDTEQMEFKKERLFKEISEYSAKLQRKYSCSAEEVLKTASFEEAEELKSLHVEYLQITEQLKAVEILYREETCKCESEEELDSEDSIDAEINIAEDIDY